MNRNPATLWKYLAVAGTGTAPTLQPLTFNSFKQISNPTTFTYDNDGDQTADATSSYQWYASGELEQAFAVTYSYDGDGNRVMKSNGKIYWRDPTGRVLDESDLSGNLTDEYVYFGNLRIAHRAVSGNTVYYYAADALGSSRSIASTASSPCFDADYYPFGGEHDYTNTCPSSYKFTGQERDAESASVNDYFGARDYSNLLGRFISPDPLDIAAADLSNPQSLNRYVYAIDNPLKYTDPTGMGYCLWGVDGNGNPDRNDRPGDGGATMDECSDQQGTWVIEGGDPQQIQNNSGNTAQIQTPETIDCINGYTGQTDSVSLYGDEIVSPSVYDQRLRLIQSYLGIFPTVCAPAGVFFYAGGKGVYGLVEYDSHSGLSSGGLFEAGKGAAGGVAATQTKSGLHVEGLLFAGEGAGAFTTVEKNPQIGPFAGYDVPKTNIAVGAGAYTTVTSVAACNGSR